MSLLMLPGYCQVPLYQKIGGNNRWPDTVVWSVCGYTTVDSDNYRWLNQYRWLMSWKPSGQCYHVVRYERLLTGKYATVYMAREILGLPRGAGLKGDLADHINHDTLKNTRDNLRIASPSQSAANRITTNVCRFSGIGVNGLGFSARIMCRGKSVIFTTMRIDIEAALMYNYSAYLLQGEFAYLNQIPEDEMPSYERQVELYETVIQKLREKI